MVLFLFVMTWSVADEVRDQSAGNEPSLSLKEAVGAALDYDPALRALRHRIQSLEAEVMQAKVFPNPEIEGEVENVAGNGAFSGTDAAEYTVVLSQPILLGGKRSKQVRVADLDRRLAEWTYESTKRELIKSVTVAYIEVLVAREQINLSEKMVLLSDELLEAAERRVKSGAASVLEQTKAEIERATSIAEQEQMTRRQRTSRRKLATLVGKATNDVTSIAGNLYELHDLPSFEDLMRRLTDNPNWARWNDELKQREAAVALEDVQRIPDLSLGVGWRRDEGADSDGFVFAASMPLPLFNRSQSARQAARNEQAAAIEERRATKLKLESELADVYSDLSQAHGQAQAIEEKILPAANRAFDVSREGYLQGRFGFLDLIDAQRTLVETRGKQIETLSKYHQAFAEIESLTGRTENDRDVAAEEQTLP
jgi:cobalt-zinc-cadmium efflux system outer membrane protein